MMILHHGWRSSASRRVRLCLEEKGLAYESHVVDMAAMEHQLMRLAEWIRVATRRFRRLARGVVLIALGHCLGSLLAAVLLHGSRL